MREGSRGTPWSTTTKLIIGLVVVFALQCIHDVHFRSAIEAQLALTRGVFTSGMVWQLFTFQLLHADELHIILNLLCLWFLGRYVEHILGTKRFLVAFFGTGVVGGLLQGALMTAFPSSYGLYVVGASAGVCGLLAIFAMLHRDADIRLFFVLPISAMALVYIQGGIDLFFTLVPSPRSNVAHPAHLGGLLAGVAFVRLGWHRDFQPLPWEGAWERLRGALRSRGSRPSPRRAADSPPADDIPVEELTTDFISSEVDPILDKISAHGIHSLTEREKTILDAARERMSRR